MIDSLLMIGAILTVVVGSGALLGSARAQSKENNTFSWTIVIRSTIVGVLLAGVAFGLGVWAWIMHHRWAEVRHTLFVIEALSSLALGSLIGWIAAFLLGRHWHTPQPRSNRIPR